MHLPISLDPKSDARPEVGGRIAIFPPGLALSVESQVSLRELYQYIDTSRMILGEIQAEVARSESNPGDFSSIKRASEMLENFSFEADSWGFDSLYEVGSGLQILLIKSSGRVRNNSFWEIVGRGLGLLSALLEQCETDFRWRLAIADMLESINQTERC